MNHYIMLLVISIITHYITGLKERRQTSADRAACSIKIYSCHLYTYEQLKVYTINTKQLVTV